jgi:sigma-B regulation protein RsbQ
MSAVERNNVHVQGRVPERWSSPTALAATRACGATSPRLSKHEFQTVLFDAVGAGRSDLSAYDPAKYADLAGYADDLVEILRELDLTQTVFVGHSVSAMVGVLASLKAPQLFSKLILVGPSPRYIDDGDYIGGFGAAQIEELLEFLADNPMGWAQAMAPAIIGNPDRPELGEELTESFCRTDPGDRQGVRPRDLYLRQSRRPAAGDDPTLILQCSDDIIAPLEVGQYVHAHIAGSQLVVLEATGHCPNLSAPAEVIAAIRAYV